MPFTWNSYGSVSLIGVHNLFVRKVGVEGEFRAVRCSTSTEKQLVRQHAIAEEDSAVLRVAPHVPQESAGLFISTTSASRRMASLRLDSRMVSGLI